MSTEEFLHNLSYQPFYWKRFGVAFRSWCFRMTTLTDEDLKNKVPKNNLGVYSIYCDKSQWSCGSGVQNFWNAINEGHLDMTYEFFNSGGHLKNRHKGCSMCLWMPYNTLIHNQTDGN